METNCENCPGPDGHKPMTLPERIAKLREPFDPQINCPINEEIYNEAIHLRAWRIHALLIIEELEETSGLRK